MIRHVRVENFRCLRDVELTLEPLTVLVGGNASGKASLLRALDHHRVWGANDGWRSQLTGTAVHVKMLDGGERSRLADRGEANQIGILGFCTQYLKLDVQALRKSNQLAIATQLDSSGANLPNLFGSLLRDDQTAVARRLSSLVRAIADVDTRPIGNGHHQLVFRDRWGKDQWYAPEEVSDGTLLMLAYLLLPYQRAQPDVMCIESVESGLHPSLFGPLVGVLRRLCTSEVGAKPMQVIVTTHASALLDHVRPEEVRLFVRDPDSGVVGIVQPATGSPMWQRAYEEHGCRLGQMWLAGVLGEGAEEPPV